MHKPKIVWPVIYLAAFFEQRDRHLHLSLSLPPITSLLHLLRTCGCFFLLLNRSVALLASPTQPGDQNQMQSLMGGSAYRPDREGRRWEGVLQGYSAVWRRGHPGNANIWANCIEENIFVPRNVVFFFKPTHPDPTALWLVCWTKSISGTWKLTNCLTCLTLYLTARSRGLHDDESRCGKWSESEVVADLTLNKVC